MSSSNSADEHYPLDFTVPAPGQKLGWLSKKTKSTGKNRYNPIWVELDELNQLVSCFSKESFLGALKSEMLMSIELENAKVKSRLSKRGKFLVIITDKNKKKYIFAAKSPTEQKAWVDSLAVALESNKSSIVRKWLDDKQTQGHDNDHQIKIADVVRDLDDSPKNEPPSGSHSSNVNSTDTESDRSLECEEDTSADVEKNLQRALYSMFLMDADGNQTLFGDIVHGQTTLLFFLRHFGCVLWRAAIEEVIAKRELFERCGIRVAAIGNGTPEMARDFLTDYPKFPGKLYLDPDTKVYKAMHCKFGIKCTLSDDALKEVRDASKKGYKQKGIHGGDPLQLGGTFIISPTQGMIYRRLENYIGSTTDLPSLIPFVMKYSANHPQATWQFTDVDIKNPESNGFKMNFYQENFAMKQHSIFVYPRTDKVNTSLILAVVDLKQDDFKCIAYHAKGKAKLYWPFYLTREEMFQQMILRIYGTHAEMDNNFIKLNRNPLITEHLFKLEETINSCSSTSDISDRLDMMLEETTRLLVKQSMNINAGSPMVGYTSACNSLTRV